MSNMIRNKLLFKSFDKLTLTSYDNVFPKDLKALIMLYMKTHNIIKVTLNYKQNLVEIVEKYPKNISVFMWLNGDISTKQFRKHMKFNVEETSEGLESFLKNVEVWFNEGRFRNG